MILKLVVTYTVGDIAGNFILKLFLHSMLKLSYFENSVPKSLIFCILAMKEIGEQS